MIIKGIAHAKSANLLQITLNANRQQFSRNGWTRKYWNRKISTNSNKRVSDIAVEPALTPKRRFLVFGILCTASIVLGYDAYYFAYVYEASPSSLQRDKYVPFELISVTPISPDTSVFRFGIFTLGGFEMFPGVSHVSFKDDRLQIQRPYTPISVTQDTMDFVIKRYNDGCVSKWLFTHRPGSKIELRGPIPTLRYRPNEHKKLTLIAGGTGIAPMFQLLQQSLHSANDQTEFHLIYANKAPHDILLKEHLDELAEQFPTRLKVDYVVDYVIDSDSKEFNGHIGRLTCKLMSSLELTPPNANNLTHRILLSGPDPMLCSLTGNSSLDWATINGQPSVPKKPFKGVLKELGYSTGEVIQL